VRLSEFRQAVDDAKPQIISKLDLDHLSHKILPNLSNFLSGELQLSPTSFDQVVDQQGGQVLRFLITRVVVQVEDL
jgi:hypothetical protein